MNIKKFLKAGLMLSLVTMTINTVSFAGGYDYLNKFGSNNKMLIGSEQVKIPTSVKDKENEFRGVWVSSVYNLDFPSKKALSKEEFKKEYMDLLNNLERLNINAVIFQVRPKLDTFYPSDINPWSEFLTGTEGKNPGWDPLKWMVEETHKKNMEFHAWFNPYRVTNNKSELGKDMDLGKLSEKNWAKQNPNEVYSFDGKLYLNPGSEKVIRHISDSIMEVASKYDVDGVHLDDYFYPYRSIKDKDKYYFDGEKLNHERFKEQYPELSDFRRNNVDTLIFTINSSMEKYNRENNKKVVFGVSPFGIWGHKEIHPVGSFEGVGSNTPISSQASYDNQFADTRKWVKNQWIDYIAPQLYWTFDEKAAPYGELVNWWSDVVRGTNVKLYIGHANYKQADVNTKNLSWKNPREISNQLKYNNSMNDVNGSIFFRYKSLLPSDNEVNNEFLNILKTEHFKEPVALNKNKIK